MNHNYADGGGFLYCVFDFSEKSEKFKYSE